MKLCYVLPVYDSMTSLHYNYNYSFVEELGKICDVMLFVERADTEVQLGNVRVVVQNTKRSAFSRVLNRYNMIVKIRRLGYNTFYVHQSFLSALICSIVTKFHGGRTFYWHCGLLIPHPGIVGHLRYIVNKSKLWLVLHSIDYLVTGSQRMSIYYQREFGVRENKVRIMPNWVDLEIFKRERYVSSTAVAKFRRTSHDRIVMFVHDLSFRKGGHLLPEIITKVCSSNSHIIFVIIGEGPYRDEIETVLIRNSLRDSVFMIGKIPNKEIPSYLAGADLFIMPSLEEGFPRVLLETMSMDIPFIATDVGGVLDIVPPNADSAIVVKSNDPTGFANAILDEISKEHNFDLRQWVIGRYDRSKVLEIFTKIMRGSPH